MSYDPQSMDAMFSRILQRMDTQDAILQRIDAGVTKTNGRVNALERWRDVITSRVALIASIVSGAVGVAGWLINIYLAK